MTALAEAVVARLAEVGVRRAYTVPGESFLPLLEAFDRHPDTALISTRHESGASFMAEADGKLTGVPAVAMATRGVGASNLAIGVHTARQDSTPLVAIIGQVETSFLGREAFQEVDLPAFYGPITKWATTVTRADRMLESLDRAVLTATTGRPGPVLLAIPADVLDGGLAEGDGWHPRVAAAYLPTIDAAAARAIGDALTSARAPIVIAGGGARRAREELIAVAQRFGAGVYASFRRQDVFPNDHPHYCGHLTLGTPPTMLAALEEADVVLVVGCRLSEITTQGYQTPRPDQFVAQIDVDPHAIGAVRPAEIGVTADARQGLAGLLAHAPATPPARDWSAAHGAYLDFSTPPEPTSGEPVHPADVIAALNDAFDPSAIITNDAGNFSVFGHRYRRFTSPATQLGPTSGAMGYAVPAAVAAKLAAPAQDVVALVGDGGFLMTGQELETAVRYGLAVTTVVFRNGLYGTIALHQGRHMGRVAGVDIGDVDIAAVARGYGAAAWQVRASEQLPQALAGARACGQAAVVDVLVDPDVLTPSATLSGLLEEAGGR